MIITELFGSSTWNTLAFFDLSFEVDIRVKRDWFTSNCRPGESITPCHIVRTVQYGFRSLSEFSESNFETSECLTLTKSDGKGETLSGLVSICDEST